MVFLDIDNCPGAITTVNSQTLSPNVLLCTYLVCLDFWSPHFVLIDLFGGPYFPKIPLVHLPDLAEMYRRRQIRIVHTLSSQKNAG